jgi:hypothetical protein
MRTVRMHACMETYRLLLGVLQWFYPVYALCFANLDPLLFGIRVVLSVESVSKGMNRNC